jgi:plasmid maintenance system antidote protein VapI
MWVSGNWRLTFSFNGDACRPAITAEISLRLAAAFGGSKTFWLEMQNRYDEQKAMEKKLLKIVPFNKAA